MHVSSSYTFLGGLMKGKVGFKRKSININIGALTNLKYKTNNNNLSSQDNGSTLDYKIPKTKIIFGQKMNNKIHLQKSQSSYNFRKSSLNVGQLKKKKSLIVNSCSSKNEKIITLISDYHNLIQNSDKR